MSIALLFPGQGSQKVGMGKDFFHASDLAKQRYEEANDIMGINLANLSFNGPEDLLRQTEFTQPAIFVSSVIIAELLIENGSVPSFVAGHSLGEYSALTVAGSLKFKDGLKLVIQRGKAMSIVGRDEKGSMAAIMGLNDQEVTKICELASTKDQIVVPANLNCPDQVVISGHIIALRRAIEIANKKGARKTIKLNVSAAFHSPLMTKTKSTMKKALDNTTIEIAQFPIIMNVTAEKVTDPKFIRQNLISQIDNPVRWTETIVTLRESGVDEYIEIGPGRVLQGLNRRIDRSLSIRGVEAFEQLEELEIV